MHSESLSFYSITGRANITNKSKGVEIAIVDLLFAGWQFDGQPHIRAGDG